MKSDASLLFFKGWVQYGSHVYRLFTEQNDWVNAKVGDMIIKRILIRKNSSLHLNVKKDIFCRITVNQKRLI